MVTLVDIFPPFGLHLRTPRLSLKVLQDTDLPPLSEAIIAGIHEPGRSPFVTSWSEAPAHQIPANTALFHWGTRVAASPQSWELSFGIWEDGTLLGVQSISGKHFPQCRTVETGSWLRRDAQGRGLGKEMRAALLLYAFDYLDARTALTAAVEWNEASQGVSRALGYRPNGSAVVLGATGAEEELRFRLDRADFVRPQWELQVSGHEAVSTFLDLDQEQDQDLDKEPDQN